MGTSLSHYRRDIVKTRLEKAEVISEVLASKGKYIYCKSDNWEAA